ncbi:MAG: tetratricopeptide repeat protein, partial [Cyanobacteria bacterium J06635_11]
VALAALGEYGDAIASYDQVLILDATHADALTGRGIAWVHLEDTAAATADLEAALALNPDNALAQETLTALAGSQPGGQSADPLPVPSPPPPSW